MFQNLCRLRTFLRNIGLLKLLSRFLNIPDTFYGIFYRKEYDKYKPVTRKFQIGNSEVNIKIIDKSHYLDICSKREKKVLRYISKNLSVGDTVWDIGANVGFYTILFAGIVGSRGMVYAFEPHPLACDYINANKEINNMENVMIFQCALGKNKETMSLAINGKTESGTHQLLQNKDGREKGHSVQTINVNVIRGDDWINENQCPIPSFIKLDVEGAEEEVLLGMKKTLSNSYCKRIIMEVHFAILEKNQKGEAPKRIYQLLKDCGFIKFKWLDSSHLVAIKG